MKPVYEYVRNHLKEWFPKLPAYGRIFRRLNRLSQAFTGLLSLIQNDFPPLSDAGRVCLIDSMPVMTANARHSSMADAGCCCTSCQTMEDRCCLAAKIPQVNRDSLSA
ncbi:hypothetical protein VU06_01880 [Desulfobulbus sp. F3]|nr:hypothetical protein [Desulfobulbus sp. F3]